MNGRLRLRARRANDAGFTLMELIVVIMLMAITASVVGYGVLDFGSSAATCNTDARSVRAAEAQYYVKHQVYGTEQQLVAGGLLAGVSNMHSVTLADSATTYTLGELGGCIGSGTWALSPGSTTTTDPGITVLVTDQTGAGVSGVTAYYQCETSCGGSGVGWTTIATTGTSGIVRAPNVGSGQYKIRVDQLGMSLTFSGVRVDQGSLVYYSAYTVTTEVDATDSAQPFEDDITSVVRPHGSGSYQSIGLMSPPSSGALVTARPVCAVNTSVSEPIKVQRSQALLPGNWDIAAQVNGVTTAQNVTIHSAQTVVTNLNAIVVHVTDPSGQPLCPATVTLTPNGQSALPSKVTDSGGIAHWAAPAGTYSVTVRYSLSGNVHQVVVNSVTVAADPVVINVDAKR